MPSAKWRAAARWWLPIAFLTACGPSHVALHLQIPTRAASNGASVSAASGSNVLSLDVDGANCNPSNLYVNKPCVSVTVCQPGGGTCVTVNDLLLDTGSVGLRIFKSVLDSSIALSSLLTPVTSGGVPLGNCVQFADGSADWGSVNLATVMMGSEPPVSIPIQVIDSAYAQVPSSCPGPVTSPTAAGAGYNGILGVGLTAQDCGSACAALSNNGMYFACNGSSCSNTTAAVSLQVENPVYALPLDNNGILLELPSVALGGVINVNGNLIFGIGTRSNNIPSGLEGFQADANTLNFTATEGGTTYSSFLDSGTNALAMPTTSSTPACTGQFQGFLCPSGTLDFAASLTSASGFPSVSVPYQIGDGATLLSSSNAVFIELGANGGTLADFGLPFFLGRNVAVGIEGRSSSLGTGPYWGF